eukprot:gene5758-52064_t
MLAVAVVLPFVRPVLAAQFEEGVAGGPGSSGAPA